MRKSRRRKSGSRWRRRLLYLVLFPVILFLAVNLLLASSLGTGFLERKVESRFGLPCSIGGISWSPWAGVQVQNIRLMPPRDSGEDLEVLRIESVKADLSWRSLLKGHKRFQRLDIQGVTGEVSLELMQALLAHGQASKMAGGSTPPAEHVPPALVDSNHHSPQAPTGVIPGPLPVDTAVPQPAGQELQKVPVDDFEGVVTFDRVNLRFFSHRFPDLTARMAGVSGVIPIWGEGAEGRLLIGDFELGGRFHSQTIEVPFILKDRFLELDDYELKLFGLNLNVTAAIWMVPGLPYGLQLNLPVQQMDLSPVYPDQEPPFTIGALQSSSQLRGHLLNPGGSTGGSYTAFQNLEILDGKDGSRTTFPSGSAYFQLSAAGLIAQDFRIMGEEEAVIGNGFATPRGDAAAIVRIIASPNRAESHKTRVKLASNQLDLQFEPLVTPDREFRDLHLKVRSGDLMIDLGKERQWVPFLPAARAILGSRDSNNPLYP